MDQRKAAGETFKWRRASGTAIGAIAVAMVALVAQACSSAERPPVGNSGRYSLATSLQNGPCSDEGAVSTCHFATASSGNVMNCVVGTQTCSGGRWTDCGAAGATIMAVDMSKVGTSNNGGLSIQTVTESAASSTAGACAANPCNPNCTGIDVDAGGLQPDGGFTSTTILGTVVGFSSFPTAKTIAQSTPTCTVGSPPGDNHVCSYDYCCASTDGTATGTCQQWISDAASACAKPAGVDYTAGIGCEDGSGSVHIPVCNRGTADSPTSGKLFLAGYPGSLNAAGSSAVCSNLGNNPPEGCIVDLAIKPIKAGKCIEIDVARAVIGQQPGVKCASGADFGNGNRASMINPPGPTNLPSALVAAYGAATYTQLGELNKCNNQSFVYTQFGSCATYGEQPPPPAAYTFDYSASCPPGYRPRWDQLLYSTSVPSLSEVIIRASAADMLADGGPATFGAPITLADIKSDGSGDPAICAPGSAAGCPKDLAKLLGASSYKPMLRVAITEIATTALPTVNSWQVSYTCVPYE